MELDVRGSVCPGPTGDTLAALKELPAGGKLVVITDYLLARQTIPWRVEQRGCSWRIMEDDGKTFRLTHPLDQEADEGSLVVPQQEASEDAD
jgi:TusA-related sulfurtransferase